MLNKQLSKKAQNRSLFSELFPEENKNMVFSVSDEYYKYFRYDDYYQSNLTDKSISQIIELVKTKQTNTVPTKDRVAADFVSKNPKFASDVMKIKNSDISVSLYPWAFKILQDEEQDPVSELIDAIKLYQKHKNDLDRDIQSFEKLSELRTYFDEKLSGNKEFYIEKIKEHALDPKNTDFVYESDKFIVVHPCTAKSAQYWGKDTTWCTSFISSNFFYHYAVCKYQYFVLTKSSPTSNRMKAFCLTYRKSKSGNFVLEKNNSTVNSSNVRILITDVKHCLGNESDGVLSAINNHLKISEVPKARNAISADDIDNMHKNSLFINLLEFCSDDIKYRVAQKIIEFRAYEYFENKLYNKKLFNDLNKKAIEKLLDENPEKYFYYKLHTTKKLKCFEEKFLERVIELGNYNDVQFIFENDKYENLRTRAISNIMEKNPSDFMIYSLWKDDAYKDLLIEAVNILRKNPEKLLKLYYYNKVKKLKPYVLEAAELLARTNPLGFISGWNWVDGKTVKYIDQEEIGSAIKIAVEELSKKYLTQDAPNHLQLA